MEIFTQTWVYSAAIDIIMAVASAGLAVSLTQGAGFHCPAALVRLLQRLGFLFLGGALMYAGLTAIVNKTTPPLFEFLTQIGFMWVLFTSAIRHFWWSPLIPLMASWRKPMHSVAFTGFGPVTPVAEAVAEVRKSK